MLRYLVWTKVLDCHPEKHAANIANKRAAKVKSIFTQTVLMYITERTIASGLKHINKLIMIVYGKIIHYSILCTSLLLSR